MVSITWAFRLTFTHIHIKDKDIFASLRVNVLGKDLNQSVLPTVMGKYWTD